MKNIFLKIWKKSKELISNDFMILFLFPTFGVVILPNIIGLIDEGKNDRLTYAMTFVVVLGINLFLKTFFEFTSKRFMNLVKLQMSCTEYLLAELDIIRDKLDILDGKINKPMQERKKK